MPNASHALLQDLVVIFNVTDMLASCCEIDMDWCDGVNDWMEFIVCKYFVDC